MFQKIVTKICRRSLSSLAKKKGSCSEPEESCLSLEKKCRVELSCGSPKVVVVGAGCAGLSAAAQLNSRGITDVTVLEACDRIGGRVLSAWLGDTLVELGLECIGKTSITNPAFNMALLYSANPGCDLVKVRPKKSVFVSVSEAKEITNFESEILLFKQILSEASTLASCETSLYHFLHLRFQQELLNYPPHLRSDAERVLYGLANELRLPLGGDIATLSASMVRLRKSFSGSPIAVRHGNSSLLHNLSICIPYENILLSKEVVKITWQEELTNKPRAKVFTQDGDEFEADYVIVTLPLGVLRERASSIFCPELPQVKTAAFNSVGVTNHDCIYLEYDQPWWTGDCRIRFGWTPSELVQEGNWLRGLGEIKTVSPSVLYMYITGPEAAYVEESTEEEVAIELTRMMRKIMGDNTIPYPHHIIVTRWGANKFCRGSLVGMLTSTTEEHLLELGAPVPRPDGCKVPVILFAGDMTVPQHYGRFSAARMSGLREAERIVELTKKFAGPPVAKGQGTG